jgi:hypothetical protein
LERRIPARLTAREGRAFAFPVGIAFGVIAGITAWRNHELATWILGGLSGSLLVAGLLVPTLLGPVQRAWMGLAHAISKVTTPIFMGIVYFVVLTPIGIARRVIGSNPVEHRPVEDSYWHTRPEGKRRGDLHRQF